MAYKKLLFTLAGLLIGMSIFLWTPKIVDAATSITTRCLKPIAEAPDTLHYFNLVGDGFPTNKDIYIVHCAGSATSTICTLGSKELDAFAKSQGFAIQQVDLFALSMKQGTTNPFRTSDGKVNVHVSARFQHGDMARFFGLTFDEVPTPTPKPDGGVVGNAGSQKVATFDFAGVAVSGGENPQNCTQIYYDPLGKVFDAKSLEPLPNVSVQLLDQNKAQYNQIGILNPQTTLLDGQFSFFVSNGTYYLQPSTPNYTFPVNTADINPQYTHYYKNLYTQQTPIVENNETVQTDIPMMPQKEPYHSDPTLDVYAVYSLPGTTNTTVEGKVSHPLTHLEISQNNKVIQRTGADSNGFFQLTVPSSVISAEYPLTVTVTKVDPVTQAVANSSKPVLIVNPIFRYIEGYAKNKDGSIIPKAIVKVLADNSFLPYYQTTADARGFFTIDTKNLPMFNYHLEYIAQGQDQAVRIETTEFARQNESYIQQQGINVLYPKQAQMRVTPIPTRANKEVFLNTNNVPTGTTQNTTATTQSGGTTSIILLVVLLIVLGGVGVGAYFYMRRRPQMPTY